MAARYQAGDEDRRTEEPAGDRGNADASHMAPDVPRARLTAAVAIGAVLLVAGACVALALLAGTGEPNVAAAPTAATEATPGTAATPAEAQATDGPADDETPLDTGAGATVTEATTEGGIALKAPAGFEDTPTCARLEKAVSDFESGGRTLAFVMVDLGTGRSATYDASRRLYPASCVKVAYCTAVAQANGGFGGSSATAEDCIVNSSNDAFHALIDSYGLSVYGSWLQGVGATDAGADAYVHYYPDMSADELACVWKAVYSFCTSDAAGASDLAGWLARTNHSALGGLMREGGTTVWSKPGWYPADGSGKVATNDAGIVFSDCGDYLCVVMSDASEDFDALFPVIDALNAAHGKMCGGHSAPLLDEGTRLSGE